MENRPLRWQNLALACLIFCYGFFLSHKLNISKADIGRLIKNGELFFQTHTIPATNLYSYTHPNFPVITHHFGASLIYYLIWKIAGFFGLSLFNLLICLVSFLIFLKLALKKSTWVASYPVALAVILLLAYRLFEIRPEQFSYLLAGAFLVILYRLITEDLSWQWVLVLAFLEIVWVNLHIYFFIGPMLIFSFILEAMLFKKNPLPCCRKLWLAFSLVILATLVNPFGLKGAVMPLIIGQKINYPINELQPIWYFFQLSIFPVFILISLMIVLTLLSHFLVFMLRRDKFEFALFLMTLIFSIAAIFSVRNIAFFACLALISLSWNLYTLTQAYIKKREVFLRPAVALAVLIFLIFSFADRWSIFVPYAQRVGWGLLEGSENAADFIKSEGMHGPIMNNMDIGSYLIFYLYPDEKVFADNRPEAYPVEFFDQEYIPMLMDSQKWKGQVRKYNFNAIVFSWRDISIWAQHFMKERIYDPEWAPVFVDPFAIIFLKRNAANSRLIQKYEIPKQAFSFGDGSL